MPIAITCPSCKHSGRVPDAALGRRLKCPKCATPFLVEADGAAPLKPVPSPSVGVPATEIATEPPPSLHQQPLPSAFDLPGEPEPAPPSEPTETAPPEIPELPPGPLPASLPWYYGFLDTYARVAMIAALALATVWLLFYLGLSVLTLIGTQGQGAVVVVTMMVAALVGFAFIVLGILLAGALILLLVDMARNLHEMRHTIQERSQHGS
jgi:hypothetical protein